MSVALKLAPADPFGRDFAAHARELPGAGLAWLDARRVAAMQAFGKTGVPNRRVESWHYTDLANALESDLALAPRVDVSRAAAGYRVLLVNGRLQNANAPDGLATVDLAAFDASTPDWVKRHLGTLAAGADQPLGAASLGLMRGGVAIRVQGNVAEVLQLEFATPPDRGETVAHSRVLIVLEEGASLKLVETHTGAGVHSLNNIGMEIVLNAGARLEHVRLQAEGPEALHVTSLGLSAGRDARYRALYATAGAQLSRVDANIALAESGAHVDIRSVAVLNSGVADITTVVEHKVPHTTSRQLFKSVIGGRGRSVNQGRVHVAQGAVKSDSHQLFRALLLGPRAEADAKPELEIFADDVVCGHGTAIGAIDEDEMFYLRSRGIPEYEARSLLIRAFLSEAMTGFADEATEAALWRRFDAVLAEAEAQS